MTTNTDIVNRALQAFGARTTVTDAELSNETSNEAIQANLILTNTRNQLLRMAPWDCALNYANLTYITSSPGTPENTSAATALWAKGQPPPPWAYEYRYPTNCLRACFIVPANQTGYSGEVPITTAVTGGAPAFWNGPPAKFKVAVDQFYSASAAAIVAAGSGYVAGEQITLASGATSSPPIGAPARVNVLTVNGSGGILTASIANDILDSETVIAGSYFAVQDNPATQGSTDGEGIGATFNLTWNGKSDQRVILTNQQNAILAYCKQIIDPNIMDPMFQEAWVYILGGGICLALTGDKALANNCIAMANEKIRIARQADGNEGLTINDVTPDFLSVRGYGSAQSASGPWSGFDWGPLWPMY